MSADKPVVLCFDGSEDARYALQAAAKLFPDRHAVVLTVWQSLSSMQSGMLGEPLAMVNPIEVDREAAAEGERIADEGARLARAAGLDAEAVAVKAAGPIWETIVEAGASFDAAVIVLGSRGLAGLRAMVFGSVSGAVLHHAERPTLIARRSSD
jgi:nucleotide-binding universal stress UspA family protein